MLTADGPQWPRLQVVYLGRESPDVDTGYGKFVQSFRSGHAELSRRVTFAFVNVEENPGIDVAATLARLRDTRPDLLLAPNADVALQATQHAPGIPLVFSSYVHPVHEGLVTSLSRRQEPVTGIWVAEQLDGKRLETLRDAYPWIRSVAVLTDRSWNTSVNALAPVEDTARRLGLSVKLLLADTSEEAQALLDAPEAREFDAWVVPRSYVAFLATPMILKRLRAWNKPVILGNTADVRAGAPLSYAVDTSFIWPGLADLSARVLAGEPAGGIPIQRPQRFVLAVRTGVDTGLPTPRIEVVRRADIVIR
ncbi:ABC transporter substrate binding protein [Roseateles cellulosilyticus]|uniref:ABC transporter substrate-binding protein n=1 Tax=Pelomonas cellulosilytica TaxID=2906762 RepID=A0ABS8XXP3_9BURK|nr:ABC transporter substrate binding protein [Pelomonas sp. P8]MCE4556460.1 hypothetical protein [Pelomonas sp. P8]